MKDIFKHGIRNEMMPKYHWHRIKNVLLYKTYRLNILKILIAMLVILIIGIIIRGGCEECEEPQRSDAHQGVRLS